MNVEELREYCLSKAHTAETMPFDEHTLVFKVAEKMFAVCGLERRPTQVNLKCDPEYSEELREQYADIFPGWHMNKVHWNTVICEGEVPLKLLKELIDHSYELVRKSLTKKRQRELGFIE